MKTKRFVHILLSTAAVGLCAATAGGSGLTGTLYRMPGHACHYYGPLGVDTYFTPNGYSANGLANTSGIDRYAVCPIPKVDKVPGNITITEYASITISTQFAVCKLYHRYEDGTAGGGWDPDGGVVSIGNGRYEYRWGGQPGAGYPTDGSQLSFYCLVPGGGKVIEGYTHSSGMYYQ